MVVAELRKKTAKDLSKMVLDHKKELLNLRFQKAGAQLTNTSRIREVRRQVARVKTVLAEMPKDKK